MNLLKKLNQTLKDFYNMGPKIIKLTESKLRDIVYKVINEQGLAGNASTGQASGGQSYTGQLNTAPAAPSSGGGMQKIAQTIKDETVKALKGNSQLQMAGWWDSHPALISFLLDTSYVKQIFYPKFEMREKGALAISKVADTNFWDFFMDGKFYVFKTQQDALNGVNYTFNGTWKGSGKNLIIKTNDGEVFNSSTKTWTKPIPWVRQSGKFPLKYLEVGGNIGTLQKALGMRGDTYFGNQTEKAVLAKAPEYKRETGVTQEIYNKIVPNVSIGKDMKTTYDMNTDAGKSAYLQQAFKPAPQLFKNIQNVPQLTSQQQSDINRIGARPDYGTPTPPPPPPPPTPEDELKSNPSVNNPY